jgi:DNA (cytosine-5)-methyltransferase 1
MLRAIQEIEPTYVVGENVRGLTNWNGGLVFEEVCVDLESQGYEVQPILLPACSVGAPHRRDRIWFIAKNTKRDGFIQRELEQEGTKVWEQRNACTGDSIGFCLSERNVTNSYSIRQHERECNNEEQPSERRINALNDIEPIHNEQSTFKHSNLQRQKRRMHTKQFKNTIREQFSERNARSYESTNWQNFPSQSPVCSGDDGISNKLDGITFSKWRNESIKGYGNAIVPQVAYEIFKVIQRLNDTV